MLYWLSQFSELFGPLNVFRYITFRTGGAVLTALLFVFLFGPTIIGRLRTLQVKGQPIRDVAAGLDRSEAAVWKLWARALLALRKKVQSLL